MVKNEKITSREVDFAKWYTDIITQAHLARYTTVKGCLVVEPYAYAIWENIQKELDSKFKATGHENLYMPMLIPESLLNKEKEHIEGFAPEVAWVTHGGKEELEEKLCVRPTSETLFCDYYSQIVKSYRDLPKLYNQWCSVMRWEKSTRPYLRTREFLWQEGHTVHASAEEAEHETMQMLNIYKDFYEKFLAIPVLVGKKTEKEKFAGAEYTLTCEALMYDGVSLQAGTSHYFGQKFSKPFDMKFLNKNNEWEFCYQTSWGVSQRSIAGIIMVHGDNNGLVLPPKVAPVQVVIVPIKNDEDVLSLAQQFRAELLNAGVRCKVDDSDKSAGFKFAEHEMKGTPVRIEIGPRDLKENKFVIARRDTNEKTTLNTSCNIVETVKNLLEQIHNNMFEKAKARNEEKTYVCESLDEVKEKLKTGTGYFKTMWCGCPECEAKMKELGGLKSRCIPFEQEHISDTCICCGKKAKEMIIWGNQY